MDNEELKEIKTAEVVKNETNEQNSEIETSPLKGEPGYRETKELEAEPYIEDDDNKKVPVGNKVVFIIIILMAVIIIVLIILIAVFKDDIPQTTGVLTLVNYLKQLIKPY